MRIDIPDNEKWTAISEAYRLALPFQDPAVQVQVYAGFQHALIEATQGLAKLFSHKKTIALVTPSEPALEAIAIAFSEEGYTVKHASAAEVASAEWLAPIQNELLFVLMTEDDPVTARLHELAPVHAALKDKRVFRIVLSHASHTVQPVQRPHLFEVRILSLKPEIALIVAGERFRVSPTLASRLPWSEQIPQTDLKLSAPRENDVREFESKLPAGFKAYFKEGEARVYDRAVIYHEELDGSALIDQLAEMSGKKLSKAGYQNLYDTSSPCRWNNPRFSDWLLDRGFTEAQVRGLVILDASEVNNLALPLASAAKTILKLQNGD